MRKIEYIFIDSDAQRCDSASGKPNSFEISRAQAVSGNAQNNNRKSGNHGKSDLRHQPSNILSYHYVVNSEGLVTNPTNVCIPSHIIQGPIYNPEKYNKCSIFIRYGGSLRLATGILKPETSCRAVFRQRAALLQLLVELRQHYPEAKILGLSEIDGKKLHSRNIIVSDAMNVLRRELSDLP